MDHCRTAALIAMMRWAAIARQICMIHSALDSANENKWKNTCQRLYYHVVLC